jgi:S-disulfanyl-L-cysteine oxidoreductase SoxD
MFKFFEHAFLVTAILVGVSPVFALDDFAGLGRAATPAEIKAWNIDVRPDFKGLPPGSGSVEQGQAIWDNKCATCHGTFAESNKVFTPLVGGVAKEDLSSGHVANLMRRDFPARTTFMKVATVSTLFDYIRRAMPWNAPKSLKDDDVYAVLAYLLNLADIVPDDFVLDEKSIRDVQKIMPNRNGMTFDHALWPGKDFNGAAKPDTANTACMSNCKTEVKIGSTLPDYAWASHGDLEKQNRAFGPTRGKKTADGPDEPRAGAVSPYELAQASGCLACHGTTAKIVGPGYNEVADKYRGHDAFAKLVSKVKSGGEGVWGSTPMPPQDELKDEEIKTLVGWILAGAKEK